MALSNGTGDIGICNPCLFGIYAEAGYFLTGETRRLNDNIWNQAKVLNPVDHIRFMLHYGCAQVEGGPLAALVDPSFSKPVDQRDDGVDAVAARMQLEF